MNDVSEILLSNEGLYVIEVVTDMIITSLVVQSWCVIQCWM